MSQKKYILVDSAVLPEVYLRVLKAKNMLAAGEAKSAAEAARLCDISRGAFYKYKDSVFDFNAEAKFETLTIQCVLKDSAGVLSSLVTELSRIGANILTINQGLPAAGSAPVSVSFRCPENFVLNDMLSCLRSLDGVKSVDLVESDSSPSR